MSKIETYAKANLSAEILAIESTNRKNEYPQLTAYELSATLTDSAAKGQFTKIK